MLYSRVFSNRFHTSIERRDLTYWSKFNFRQALSYQLEAFPCEHGIDKPKSINNYRNQFAQLELNLRLIKKDRILATTEKQYLIYQYLMNEVHGIRSKQLLSPSIYVNDLCKNYLSSFDANKVKIFSKQFENQYFR